MQDQNNPSQILSTACAITLVSKQWKHYGRKILYNRIIICTFPGLVPDSHANSDPSSLKVMNTLVNFGETVAPYIQYIKFDTLETVPKIWENPVASNARGNWYNLVKEQGSWLVKLLFRTINLENIIFGSTFSEFQIAVEMLDIISNSPNRVSSIVFTKCYASIEISPFFPKKIHSIQDFLVILKRFENLKDMRFMYSDGDNNARSVALLARTKESTLVPPLLPIRQLGYNNTHSNFSEALWPLINLPLLECLHLTWEDASTSHLPSVISPLLKSFILTLHGWECNEHSISIEESFRPLSKYLALHPRLQSFSLDIEETSLDDPVDEQSLDSLIYCITRVIDDIDQIPLVVIKLPFEIASTRNFVALLTKTMKVRGSKSADNVMIISLMIEGQMAGSIMCKGPLGKLIASSPSFSFRKDADYIRPINSLGQ